MFRIVCKWAHNRGAQSSMVLEALIWENPKNKRGGKKMHCKTYSSRDKLKTRWYSATMWSISCAWLAVLSFRVSVSLDCTIRYMGRKMKKKSWTKTIGVQAPIMQLKKTKEVRIHRISRGRTILGNMDTTPLRQPVSSWTAVLCDAMCSRPSACSVDTMTVVHCCDNYRKAEHHVCNY